MADPPLESFLTMTISQVNSLYSSSSQDETLELYFWHRVLNCIIYHQAQDELSTILLEGNRHCCWKHPAFLQYVKSISFQWNGWKLILRLVVNIMIEDMMTKAELWSLILGSATGCWLDRLSWSPFSLTWSYQGLSDRDAHAYNL